MCLKWQTILCGVIADHHIMYVLPILLVLQLLKIDNVKSLGKPMLTNLLSQL